MAFFDDLKDKAMDLAQSGVAKSKQLAEIAKLNINNTAEEDTVKKAYTEIGKLYYAERGMAPDVAYTALCEKITTAKITIEENRGRIAAIKAENNVKDEDIVPPVTTNIPPEEPLHIVTTEENQDDSTF